MQALDTAFIKLSHGNYESLGRACAVTGDIRGQTTDYWSGWMEEVAPGAEGKYYELLHKAGHYAWPIDITSSGTWSPGDLTTAYNAVIKEPLNPPPQLADLSIESESRRQKRRSCRPDWHLPA